MEAVSSPFDDLWGGLRLWGCDYDELAILGDLDPHVLHTRLTSGPNSLGDVGLPECGGRASHWTTVRSAYRPLLPARGAPTVPRIRLSQSGPPVHRDAGAQAHKLGWRRV